jgi:hypothetical protein
MKISQLLVCLSLLATSVARAQGGPFDDPGFVPLFNGQDLSGWTGNPKFWSVEDGAITARRVTAERPGFGNTFLIWTGGEVKNFELRASFRLMSGSSGGWANSGIQYRSRVVDPANWVVRGYQADMDLTRPYTGQLYEEGYRGFLALPGQRVRITTGEGKPHIEVLGATASPDAVKAAFNRDGWNEYIIIADGNHLRQYLNGVLTAEAFDLDEPNAAKSGVLALQLHAGAPMSVQFKNILLKTLP